LNGLLLDWCKDEDGMQRANRGFNVREYASEPLNTLKMDISPKLRIYYAAWPYPRLIRPEQALCVVVDAQSKLGKEINNWRHGSTFHRIRGHPECTAKLLSIQQRRYVASPIPREIL